WVVNGRKKCCPLKINNRYFHPIEINKNKAFSRVVTWKICRTNQIFCIIYKFKNLFFIPIVISHRNHLAAPLQKLFIYLFGYAFSMGSIFSIYDCKHRLIFVLQLWQIGFYHFSSGGADNVPNKQNFHLPSSQLY